MSTSWGGPLKNIALLTYLLLLLLVFVMLVKEWQDEVPVFSLTATAAKTVSGQPTLELYGEHFHPDLKGVLTKNLIKEEALLWRHFQDVPFKFIDKRDNLLLSSYNRNKLVTVSFSEETPPKLLSSIEVGGVIGQIKIVGNKAVVGLTRSGGITVVDMSDPENLTLAAHYPFEGTVYSIVEGQGFVFLTGVGAGVVRIDFAEENSEPVTLATLDSAWRMAIQGNRLAVATLKGRVHLFEIGGEGQLVEVGTLNFPDTVWDVAFTDEKLVVAVTDKSLSVFSLSDWPALQPAVVLNLPAQPAGMGRVPGQERMVVSLISNGFCLVDVNQRQKPLLRGWLKLPQSYQRFIVGPEQVITTGYNGLEGYSLAGMGSDDMSMLALDAVVKQEFYRLETWNEYVYGFDEQGVAKILDRPRENTPPLNRYLPFVDKQDIVFFIQQENGQLQKVGALSLQEAALDVRYQNGYLYVLQNEGLRIFSGENPGELVAISELLLPGNPERFELLSSGAIMVSSRDQGLLVVDAGDPEEPKLVSRLEMPGHLKSHVARGMLVDGSRLYVSLGVGGVQVIDISTPLHPELVQIVDSPGYASEMALHEGFLLVVDGPSGLFLVDVEDSRQALPVGSLPVPLRVQQIAVAEDGLIVSNKTGGTMKLPMPQKLRGLRMVNEGEMVADVAAVEKGQYVYIYDQRYSGRIAVDVQ